MKVQIPRARGNSEAPDVRGARGGALGQSAAGFQREHHGVQRRPREERLRN